MEFGNFGNAETSKSKTFPIDIGGGILHEIWHSVRSGLGRFDELSYLSHAGPAAGHASGRPDW
jgi:hypothetical protein